MDKKTTSPSGKKARLSRSRGFKAFWEKEPLSTTAEEIEEVTVVLKNTEKDLKNIVQKR